MIDFNKPYSLNSLQKKHEQKDQPFYCIVKQEYPALQLLLLPML